MDGQPRDGRYPKGAIGEARAAFLAALKSGNARAASAVYAKDARLLPPAAELLRGRGAIEAFWRAGVEAGLADVELEPFDLECRGGVAFEIGRYTLRLQLPAGRAVIDPGTYVLVHELQPDGAWRRAVEMFNPDSPATTSTESRRSETRHVSHVLGGSQAHQR